MFNDQIVEYISSNEYKEPRTNDIIRPMSSNYLTNLSEQGSKTGDSQCKHKYKML